MKNTIPNTPFIPIPLQLTKKIGQRCMGIRSKVLSIRSFLEEMFVKAGENVTFSDELHKVLVFIPGVGQQNTKI